MDDEERQKLARQVSREATHVFDLLSHALKIHLNLEQVFQVNSSTLFVQLVTMKIDALKDKQIRTVGEGRFRFPNQSLQNGNDAPDQYYSLRVSLHSSRENRSFLLGSPL